ncbi:MAG: hypothetical protein OXI16_14040 [Chloroflexota bacterium]|nr:hypothetical protein [Chloroflexota bacterium]
MAQTALSAATRDALSVLVSAYGGLQQRYGEFYIVESRVTPHLRTAYRTFQNYLTKLRKLGLIEILVRGPNQFGPRTIWRMCLDVVRQKPQLAFDMDGGDATEEVETKPMNPSTDADVVDVKVAIEREDKADSVEITPPSADQTTAEQIAALEHILDLQGSALASVHSATNRQRLLEGAAPISRKEFLLEQGVAVEDDHAADAVFGEALSVRYGASVEEPTPNYADAVPVLVESARMDGAMSLVARVEATLIEISSGMSERKDFRLERWHRNKLVQAEKVWMGDHNGDPVPESVIIAAIRRIDRRQDEPENFAAYLAGAIASMLKNGDDGARVSKENLQGYLRSKGDLRALGVQKNSY